MARNIPDSFLPNFKSQSELQCFTNSSEEQTEDAAEEKGISKKGRKEKIDFQVHPSGVAQDGEIAFLYTAAVAGEAGDGHGFKSRSLYFGMG